MGFRIALALALLGAAFQPSRSLAADAPKPETAAAPVHRVFMPNDLQWVNAAPSLPPGARVAILEGNPDDSGLFTMRLLLPAGYAVPPHWYPADENMTVISGEISMATGETFDSSKGHELTAGAFSLMPAGLKHYAWTTTGAVIQVHAMGPWGITYVNPEDDPRIQKTPPK
jgi:hypothetical protein